MAAMRSLEKLKAEDALPTLRRVADRELEGRVVRTARETVTAIRAGANSPDDVKKLRDDLGKVEDENRSLKERLEKLEAQVKKASDGADKPKPRRKK
jgi:cell division protein FtsB